MEGFQRILGMCWSCSWSMRDELNVSNPGSHNQVFQLLSKLRFLRNSKFPSTKRTLHISDIFGYFLFIGVLYQRMKSEFFLILSEDQNFTDSAHNRPFHTIKVTLVAIINSHGVAFSIQTILAFLCLMV